MGKVSGNFTVQICGGRGEAWFDRADLSIDRCFYKIIFCLADSGKLRGTVFAVHLSEYAVAARG